MSYISVQGENGQQIEFSDMALFEESKNSFRFNDELLRRVKENQVAGRAPFDGIDFPRGRLGNQGMSRLFFCSSEGERDIFNDALQDQIDNHWKDSKTTELFDFVNKISQSNHSDKFMQPVYESVNRHKYSENFMEKIPVTTMVLLDDYVYRNNKDYKREDSILWCADSENIGKSSVESEAAQAVTRVVAELSKRGASAEIKSLIPAMAKADLHTLNNEQKNNIFTAIERCGKEYSKKYLQQARIVNLTPELFVHKENMTLEDVRFFDYRGNTGERQLDQYQLLRMAPEDNKAAQVIRTQMAVEIFIEKAKQKADDINVANGYVEDNDLLNGIKQNPEVIKTMGVQVPHRLKDIISQDKELSQHPDLKFFVFGRRLNGSFGSDKDKYVPRGLAEFETSLQDIAAYGFNAGYGVEIVTDKVREILDEYKKVDIEKRYTNMLESVQIRETCENLEKENSELEAWGRGPGFREDQCQKYGMSNDDIFRMARDKALGKDVAPITYEQNETKGVARLFMKKSAKIEEANENKAKKEFFDAVNKYIDDFSIQIGKEPLAKDLLSQYSSLEEIKEKVQKNDIYLQDDNNRRKRDYYCSEHDREAVIKGKEAFNRLQEAYKAAQQKLEQQLAAKMQAHTSSGVKDMEQGTGFDTMAVKAKLRRQSPKLSVQELYAKINQIRTEGKYTSEIKIKNMPKEEVKQAEQPVQQQQQMKWTDNNIKLSLPDDLYSKNKHIQEAIDLVRNNKYENIDVLLADKENFGKLPKYAQRVAHQLYVGINHTKLWRTQNQATQWCKLAVRNGEKAAKEQANKIRGLGKAASAQVTKRGVSNTAMRQAIQNSAGR